MKKSHYFRYIIFFIAALIAGCDDASTPPDAKFQNTIPVDTFRLAYNTIPFDSLFIEERHVFYIPSSAQHYTEKVILVLFDPQGKPQSAIQKYRQLAETYSIILAGTQDSKNGIGLAQAEAAGRKLIKEIEERFENDSISIFVGGFSGGSQVAFAMGNHPLVKGIMYSGTPGNLPERRISIMGLAGQMDMNYADLVRFGTLVPTEYNHTILRYQGKHEWPPAQVMEATFSWLKCQAGDAMHCGDDDLKNKIKGLNNGLENVWQKYQTSAYCLFVKNSMGEETYQEKQLLQAIQTSAEFQKAMSKESSDLAQELNLKEVYTNAFFEKDKSWWTNEISRLQKLQNLQPANARLIGYFSLLAYSLGMRALDSRDTAGAALILHIYRLADPDNAEQCYMQARLQAQKGNKEKAIYYLKEAVQKGVTDREKLFHNDFSNIIGEHDIQHLLQTNFKTSP